MLHFLNRFGFQLLLISFLYFSSTNAQFSWIQKGLDFEGNSDVQQLGNDVSLSADGNTLAVASRFYTHGIMSGCGKVEIYTWDGNTWQQKGNSLIGDGLGAGFGYSICLSADGNTLLAGASGTSYATVHSWNGSDWIQKGSTIYSDAADDKFGTEVSISADGTIIAISAIANDQAGDDAGLTKIYSWDGLGWSQMGSTILGEGPQERFGQSLDISPDGSTIAIGGSAWNGCLGPGEGKTHIYTWLGGDWFQKGSTILGVSPSDYSGCSVSLNEDGNTIAIGAFGNDDNGTGTGHARVFDWNGALWVQRGVSILGTELNELSGTSVSLSYDGNRCAVGSNSYCGTLVWDPNDYGRGRVRVFDWNGSSWIQIGQPIVGTEPLAECSIVDLDENGSTLAAGAYKNKSNGIYDSGQARVFEYTSVAAIETISEDFIQVFPNPTTDFLNLKNLQSIEDFHSIEIQNYLGQVLFSTSSNQEIIDLSMFAPGNYMCIIRTSTQSQKIAFVKL